MNLRLSIKISPYPFLDFNHSNASAAKAPAIFEATGAANNYFPKILPKNPLFFSPLPAAVADERLGALFTESLNLIGPLSQAPAASG